MRLLYIFIFFFVVGVISLNATNDKKKKKSNEDDILPLNTGVISMGGGLGMTSFSGDIGRNESIIFASRFKTAYHGYVEKRFGKILGVSAMGTFGKLSENQKSVNSHLNFETKFQQFGVNVQGHFDWKSTTYVAPYVSLGVSYMLFQPYTDLIGKNGAYHYWRDGSIRDLPEFNEDGTVSQQNLAESKIITRDYSYETPLTTSFDSSNTSNYPTGTLVFPVTFGFKIKMYEFLEGRISATYNVTQSDFIDNYKEGGNDAYFYGAFSLHYTFGKKFIHPKEKPYQKVDFAKLGKSDVDGDGVSDFDDKCPNTKRGIPVDKYGCPMDTDKDGVPDYRDQEANTKPGAHVDGMGRTISDADFARLDSIRKGIYVKRSAKINEAPSDETLRELGIDIEEGIKSRGGPKFALPSKFAFADINNDGIIQATEITNAIDMFFSGEVDTNVATIMEMIDFFFEQY